MKTHDIMLRQGNWLFRRRSYLPLLLVATAVFIMWLERPLLLDGNIWFTLGCLIVAAGGEAIRVLAVGYAADRTSGRNVKQQVADEINKTGIYSLVRHPLYLGNFLIWLGVALFAEVCWITFIFIMVYFLYYERIILAEEDFLEKKFGDEFREYSLKVPAILISFKNYVPNQNSFRVKKVLRQENSTVYGIAVIFTFLKLVKGVINQQQVRLDSEWIGIFVIFTLLYLILRFLKKRSSVLRDTQK